jgi:hypothetical protein
VSWIYILFQYTKWSTLEFKAVSSFILFGSLFVLLGLSFLNHNIKSLNTIPLVIGPILVILGTSFCLAPTIINPKFFVQRITYWKWYGIISFLIQCVLLSYFLLIKLPLSSIIIGILIILTTVFYNYYTISSIKAQELLGYKEEQKDILRAFTRPQLITEKEVTISKEKKICLVCKGKISRLTYICPNCEAIYCEKCSNTLSDLENRCWVCETPFDESKPVKLPEKEEEDIEIKKGKNIEK